jgi:protein-L-isoaspartate(D-aspartate) O-methyltransferase
MSDRWDGDYDAARRVLLERVATEARETSGLTGCDRFSDRVMGALAAVPRHLFVPAERREWAYADMPLPIGLGQTISQPFIVALMTELLALEPDAVVLEIGTGSGYQTAVLARLARQVYSVERIPELAESAVRRLRELGYANIEVRAGDGGQGWEEHAPFDGIMVTAAAEEIPPALVRQLKRGGRLIVPVGAPYQTQNLLLLHKDEQGAVHARSVLPVAFVPLVRDRD